STLDSSLAYCSLPVFSFTAPPATELYPLSLHDALPIWPVHNRSRGGLIHPGRLSRLALMDRAAADAAARDARRCRVCSNTSLLRSEEHTSELQSRENLVCRLLLEKKKHTTAAYSHDETR